MVLKHSNENPNCLASVLVQTKAQMSCVDIVCPGWQNHGFIRLTVDGIGMDGKVFRQWLSPFLPNTVFRGMRDGERYAFGELQSLWPAANERHFLPPEEGDTAPRPAVYRHPEWRFDCVTAPWEFALSLCASSDDCEAVTQRDLWVVCVHGIDIDETRHAEGDSVPDFIGDKP